MSKLFSPDIPEPEDPAPLPNEEDIVRARRRRLSALRTRKGRASTNMSESSGPAGVEFSRTLLG